MNLDLEEYKSKSSIKGVHKHLDMKEKDSCQRLQTRVSIKTTPSSTIDLEMGSYQLTQGTSLALEKKIELLLRAWGVSLVGMRSRRCIHLHGRPERRR